MSITIKSVADLGLAVRAVRRSAKVRLDDLAAVAGVSKQFVSDVEYGKPTVQLGLVLKLLDELGIPIQLDIPQDANAELIALQQQGGPRRSPSNAVTVKRRAPTKKSPPRIDPPVIESTPVTIDAAKSDGEADAKT